MILRLTLALCLCCLYMACDVDRDFVTGDAVRLRLGVDTVSFDTVFTARGSATREFKVYNDGSDPVKIDRIAVQGMTGVNFTFTVDGTYGPEARDVVIWGKDSIFVYVEAEVDPTSPEEVSPFIAEDLLLFQTGSMQEQVVLQAFGQNANYLNGFNRGSFVRLTCQDSVFTLPVELPTVIYGSVFVDSCTLRAIAGTRVYFHGGLQRNQAVLGGSGIFNDGFIYTEPSGRLELLGTAEEPVLLATDRLEPAFVDSKGGYRGLILGPGSRGNRIEYTEIRNAIVGVTADSLAEVTIDHAIIANTGGPAISSYQSDITARNSLFHSNVGDAVQALKGGSLLLEHCTIANYGVDATALVLSNIFCDPNTEAPCLLAPLSATVRNSIVSGAKSTELTLVDFYERKEAAQFDVRIEHSVVRTDERFLRPIDPGVVGYPDFYETICQNCYNLQAGDDLFESIGDDDYRPDSLSVARDLGRYLTDPELPIDLDGNPRPTDTPDAGAYEWQSGQ